MEATEVRNFYFEYQVNSQNFLKKNKPDIDFSEENFLDWIRIYPYFRAPNNLTHCYEKICTIISISILYYFTTYPRTNDRKKKTIIWNQDRGKYLEVEIEWKYSGYHEF